MPDIDPERARLILAELATREAGKLETEKLCHDILAELFDKQLQFVEDPSREKAALCTRRAGKTSMWTRYTTTVALRNPRTIIRIWAVNRLRAKQLLWQEFKYLFARHRVKLAKDPNETELTIFFENGSEIRLLGADKDKEVQKKRGDKTIMEVVLEAQLFGPYLKSLVEDVAGPCLFDLRGTFCLEGTPGPVCAGYFYSITGRNNFAARWTSDGDDAAGWSCHRWSVLDNPFLPHAREELAALKAKKRWSDDDPTYLREWCAQWVNDFGALFYRYDPLRNTYDPEKFQPWGEGWVHTLGWDLGSIDDMALVVWGYHPSYPGLYEAFSWKKPGALSKEVVGQIEKLEKRGFNITSKVADTGGGGKMYVEEVMSRTSHVFEPAKKTEKSEHVRLMNEDYREGIIQLAKGSALVEEVSQLPTDPDWPDPKKPNEPPGEDSRFPNHLSDAHLYAWRKARHFLHRPKVPPKPKVQQREERVLRDLAKGTEAQQNIGTWLSKYDPGPGDFE